MRRQLQNAEYKQVQEPSQVRTGFKATEVHAHLLSACGPIFCFFSLHLPINHGVR